MLQKEIIVFGTGASGKIFIDDIIQYNHICDKFGFSTEKITVKCCTDTRSERVGSNFCGYEVIDANVMKNHEFLKNRLIVIATAEYYDEIAEKCKEMGYGDRIIDFRQFFLSIIEKECEDERKLIFYDEILKNLKFINLDDRQLQSCRYDLGKRLLEYSLKSEKNCKLIKKGVSHFINAFQLDSKQKDILNYLEKKFYDHNAEWLRVNYGYNRALIFSTYGLQFPPQISELCFVIYPLSDTQWCCFDQIKKRLIYRENDQAGFCKYDLLYEICCRKLTECCDQLLAEQLKGLWQEIEAYQILKQFTILDKRKEKIEYAFFLKIELYGKLKPYDDHYYWMKGHYYIQQNDDALAINVLQVGIDYNPYSPKLNFLLGTVYFALRQWANAAQRFLLSDFIKLGITIEMSHKLNISAEVEDKLSQIIDIAKQESEITLKSVLDSISEVVTYSRFFPWLNQVSLDADNKFMITNTIALGIPLYGNEFQGFLGIEGSQEARTERFKKLEDLAQKMVHTPVNALSFWSIIEGKEKNNVVIDKPCLLPVMMKRDYQHVKFAYEDQQYECGIEGGADGGVGYNRFIAHKPEYLRIEDKVSISSDENFIVGKPISLVHSPKRRKIVINILIDALSALSLQENPDLMPNTMEFFAKGTVFRNVFSPCEWTVPAVASLLSGCYPEKTRYYRSAAPKFRKLDDRFKTTVEYMNEKGYYCINFSAVFYSLAYGGIYRGFEKNIGSRSASTATYVMQALEHMRCLSETDLFINMHLLDVHDSAFTPNNKMGVYTKYSIERILQYDKLNDGSKKSAWIEFSEEKKALYQAELKNTDGSLGILYDYINKHYQNDDCLVVFHADHGRSSEEKGSFILDDCRTKVPLMIRGNGVPQGIVTDDFVNLIDIHAIYAYLCGFKTAEYVDCKLPRVFGGVGRDYVVSSSSYPTQTYKMAIRNREHEFRLETAAETDSYGNIDMDLFSYEILSRLSKERIEGNQGLEQYFKKIAFDHAKYISR